jgi:antitoxin component of MazEF toxin-antitoxin module
MLTIHKLIKIGNSCGVTIPKKFLDFTKLKAGKTVAIEFNTEYKTLVVKPKSQTYNHFLTPEFFKWYKKNNKHTLEKILKK